MRLRYVCKRKSWRMRVWDINVIRIRKKGEVEDTEGRKNENAKRRRKGTGNRK